jgi:catechol 2,3-dioxygenase-like lactoylglutathione lyase family enzyme
MIAGGHVTLAVTDLRRAIRFYVETLGMKLVARAERTGSIDIGEGIVIVLLSGRTVNQVVPAALGQSVPNAMVGLRVKARLDDAVAVFENRGVTFVLQDTGPHRRAHFRDPDNNEFYLYEGSATD